MQTEDDIQEIMAEVGKSPLSLDTFEGKIDTRIDKWSVKAEIKEHNKKQSFWIDELRRRAALEKGISTFWMAVCSNWPCGCSCAELEMRVRFSGEIEQSTRLRIKNMGASSMLIGIRSSLWSLWDTVVFRDRGNKENITKEDD